MVDEAVCNNHNKPKENGEVRENVKVSESLDSSHPVERHKENKASKPKPPDVPLFLKSSLRIV